MQKVRDDIVNLYTSHAAPDAGASPTPAQQLTLAFEPLGIPMTPAMFLAHPGDTTPSPALALEWLTSLANQVPEVDAEIYRRTGRNVDESYWLLTQGAEPDPAAGSGTADLLATVQAQAKQILDQNRLASLLNPNETFHPVYSDPTDWYVSNSSGWTALSYHTASGPPPAPPAPPAPVVVSSGTGTIRGTWSFDFDTGQEGTGGDVFWEQATATVRSMDPKGNARIADLGPVDYDALTPESLSTIAFGSAPISGSDGPADRLQVGRVFAVRTNGGHLAKVQVLKREPLSGNNTMTIRWTTFAQAATPHRQFLMTAVATHTWSLLLAAPEDTAHLEAAIGPAALAQPVPPPVVRAPAAAVVPGVLPPAEQIVPRMAAAPIFRLNQVAHVTVATPPPIIAHPVLRNSIVLRPGIVDILLHSTVAPADSDSFDLAFEVCAATLKRPWLSWAFLSTRGWFVPGYHAGDFAPGALLPAMPIGVILARKLSVKSHQATDDSAARAIGFGPFSFEGRIASVQQVTGHVDVSIACDGVQVIAWISQVLDDLPPISDPSLPPS
jgi:hypothetical protein